MPDQYFWARSSLKPSSNVPPEPETNRTGVGALFGVHFRVYLIFYEIPEIAGVGATNLAELLKSSPRSAYFGFVLSAQSGVDERLHPGTARSSYNHIAQCIII